MKKLSSFVIAIGVIGICTGTALSAQQSWSQVLAGSRRFLTLTQFDNAAVLDKETGLVWQHTPLAEELAWVQAQFYCTHLTVGNRRGWRLPTVQELESLVDPSQSGVALPAGHPFGPVDPDFYYWTSNADVFDPLAVWAVTLADGNTGRGPRCLPGSGCGAPKIRLSAWCVRGGSSGDAQ